MTRRIGPGDWPLFNDFDSTNGEIYRGQKHGNTGHRRFHSLIVIDDIGLLPEAHEPSGAFFRGIDATYETRSIALSSNLHPAGFDELMPKQIANAAVDRLLHHAHLVLTQRGSIRLTQATAGKGVTPLTR